MSAGAQGPNSQPEWSDCLPPAPEFGSQVPTACGGYVQYCATTPCAVIGGQRIFFCLAICKADYERDPSRSCLSVGPHRSLI